MHYQNACMRVDRQQLHHPSIRNTLRTEHFDNLQWEITILNKH